MPMPSTNAHTMPIATGTRQDAEPVAYLVPIEMQSAGLNEY